MIHRLTHRSTSRPAFRPAGRLLSTATAVTTAGVLLSGCSGFASDRHREVSYGVRAPVHKLVIKGDTGDVRVTGGSTTVSVTERQNYRSSPPHTTHTTAADGTLTLTYDCDDCGVDYDVNVPTGTTVSVAEDTGDVSLTALGGPVTAETDTGDITGTRLTAERAELTTDTGEVRAAFSRTPSAVQAGTQTGDIDIAVPRGTRYAVRAGAQTGKVDVRVDQADDSPRAITAKAQTGDVTVEPA
ncbi:DUF4097 family beta strand repeat-containing protein [Streptomyces alanosinicus]|uniref:DUF4097 domain-containing protein n=1 Tax=Streptomyces alanosinicus TaxID=68171 RepID=A0A919D1L5_9ACTN|nr:DUF4097 family beta strand repeat-containing protein [Streptomyces alanosinicus]GHE03638.1 hypothetical protein GCM10010339_31760 [Streptomyces alanosinicus]